MIEFVDLKDGRVFNGDKPYEFWFENGQSVNLNYVKKICFISSDRIVEAHINSEVFSLLNLQQNLPQLNTPEAQGEIINDKLYMNIDDLKTNHFVSIGYPYNHLYVHMIYILAHSDEVGEIHDVFTLTARNEVNTYQIAGDFYADNEILKTNLGNFDIHIPESIQKAIFDINVHEEANDNITLNRKYKELLMNYWDIIANKGSYNSLQNSLAWFEWGDLVRIEELWKRHHEGMEEYFQTELNRELDYEFIAEFLNNSKTTYIGLYMALSKLVMDGDHFKWQDDVVNTDTPDNQIWSEENPVLEEVVTKWQLIDLCLKMTLLGNFYSTYFVPIHMDVIHSTLEHWVFAYTIKVLHSTGISQYTTLNNVRTFDMIYPKRVKMYEHTCRNYSDTLFLNKISRGPVFGYEENLRNEPNTLFNTTGAFIEYRMSGTYGVINFRIGEDEPILACNDDDRIVRANLIWVKDGNFGGVETYTSIQPTHIERPGFRASQWAFLFDFSLGFDDPGKYTLTFQFDTLYGNTWTKTLDVEIEDTTRNMIGFYKVVDLKKVVDFEIPNPDRGMDWLGCFQINMNDGGTILRYNEHNIIVGDFFNVGMNHTVIFDVDENTQYLTIQYDESHQIQVPTTNLKQNLKTLVPGYLWIVNPSFTVSGHTIPTRVIGIRRKYGMEGSDIISFVDNATNLIISYRFHPIMHRLEPIDDWKIKTNDLIYMIPQLGHSRNFEVYNWEFENQTTGQTFKSHLNTLNEKRKKTGEIHGGSKGWLLAPQEPVSLKPGYYNIKLQYLKGNEPQEYVVKSAFLMNK